MSWLTDFDKLHISTKSISISLSALVPFWVISIYLFRRPLYDSGDYIIIGAFVLGFSISYYLIRLALAVAIWLLDDADSEFELMIFGVAGVGCFLNLCFWIVLGYSLDFSFFTFLIWLYSAPTLLAIILFVILIAQDEKKDSSASDAEIQKVKDDYAPVAEEGGSSSLEPNVE